MAHAWKACWVQALGGSNPPSSATGPRDRFRFRGFCCLWRRWCSGRRRARPPARSPHASLRLGVVDLEARPCPPDPPAPSTPAALVVLGLARPGPAAAHRHRGQALQPSAPAALVVLGLARPGPATAHRHRGQALRCPPHRRRPLDVWFGASSRCPGQALLPPTSTAARPCLDTARRRRGKL